MWLINTIVSLSKKLIPLKKQNEKTNINFTMCAWLGSGQMIELLNNSDLIMSKPYYQEDNFNPKSLNQDHIL